ncbi:hypothetical protein B0H19DRAFT_1074539 [Mycena capillaripes]|nr:hypothetical protein B0H19DRAFT_1074539 [Mycena capillaripes]
MSILPPKVTERPSRKSRPPDVPEVEGNLVTSVQRKMDQKLRPEAGRLDKRKQLVKASPPPESNLRIQPKEEIPAKHEKSRGIAGAGTKSGQKEGYTNLTVRVHDSSSTYRTQHAESPPVPHYYQFPSQASPPPNRLLRTDTTFWGGLGQPRAWGVLHRNVGRNDLGFILVEKQPRNASETPLEKNDL